MRLRPKTQQKWQIEKARTAKALRKMPTCGTAGCTGKAVGTSWGSDLCPRCAASAKRAPLNADENTPFTPAMALLQGEIEKREPQREMVLNQDARSGT